MEQGTLKEQGYRFIFRNGQAAWIHPLEVQFDDIDCTDMDDEDFAVIVAKVNAQ